jgi:hypothetical protein
MTSKPSRMRASLVHRHLPDVNGVKDCIAKANGQPVRRCKGSARKPLLMLVCVEQSVADRSRRPAKNRERLRSGKTEAYSTAKLDAAGRTGYPLASVVNACSSIEATELKRTNGPAVDLTSFQPDAPRAETVPSVKTQLGERVGRDQLRDPDQSCAYVRRQFGDFSVTAVFSVSTLQATER